MLRITFANRFETLRDALLDGIAEAPASPFVAEQVIVPSSALRRDLTLAIAERHGICANVEFAFLAQWLWRQIGRVVPAVAAETPFAAPVLAWRILQIFEDADFVAGFPRLQRYLRQADAVARFDFARKVAALFEQYLTYRPAWLAAWAAGRNVAMARASSTVEEDQAWQAALWRAIATQLGMEREHPAARFLRKVEAIGPDARARFGLPDTAHVFCPPTIPPLYLDLLRQLGHWVDLRLYVLNPCREYWFEIIDRRRLGYLAARGGAAWHETGNRLLAAWGKQTQAHIDLLLENADAALVDDGGFIEAPATTMLARIQNAVLDLVELAPASITPDADDRSVEIHVCHSLTRELEVLQDQLLALFAGPNPPRPCDILVVTPDLEAAAPLVEAVFGNAPHDRSIPYAISGRSRATVNVPARALLALLALLSSRFPASAVFALLQQPIVGRRYGIAADDLVAIQTWMKAAGIRWGIDARHREQQGLPGLDRFSFDDGMQRLFLGYALPDKVARPWHGLLPAGSVEGGDAQALGLFARFVTDLTRLRADFTQAKPPALWMRRLFETLDTFLAAADTEVDTEIDDLGEVRDTIRELHDNMVRGGVTAPVPLEVIRAALEALLDDPARGGVPTGSVTFSSISSLRNLPFRVICAIGLNDGAFPSTARPLEFDLMALSPQRGDRQRRSDERNQFLDLLLAARERLYLSYTGRGIRDNAPLPASVLVSELIETLLPAIAADPASAASREQAYRRLVVEHPLQPFSPSYFHVDTDPRARSFNRELCEALRQGLADTTPLPEIPEPADAADDEDENDDDAMAPEIVGRFFKTPLAAAGEEWLEVSLERLIRFFRNPCRFLLRERLGIELAEADEELADEEPFLPDFMGRQALAERLLPRYRDGFEAADLRALALAGIEYPPGHFGDLLLDEELLNLRIYAEAVAQATAAPCLAPHHASLDFDLDGETWRLAGAFADLRESGLVRQRYDDTRATDYLEAWLHHLFLCASRPEGVAPVTRWLSRNGEFRLLPCAAAGEVLHALLRLYRRGLHAPIHFFPKSAWKYSVGGGSLSKANAAWRSNWNAARGEGEQPAYRLALRGVADPIDNGFIACAEAVYGPLLQHLEDARLGAVHE